MQTKHAAFFVPARYPGEHQKPLRTNSGFEPKAVKIGEEDGDDIWRLYFEDAFRNRAYLIIGKVINRKWQDVGELKVWSRDETYVDVKFPPGNGCMFILIAP